MIPWHAIDTVLLDMDGTLLDLHFDNYFWLEHLPLRYAEKNALNLSEARRHIHELIHEAQGTLQWYCLDHWSQLMAMSIAELKREVAHKIQARPHTMAFLQFLQHSQKRVLLITNAHRDSLDLKLACTDIAPYFHQIISSHDYGAPKESQDFWLALAKAEHFDPARSLFIDDTPRVLASAQLFGIAHLICITEPDSQRQANCAGDFLGIADFNEIMPVADL